MEPNTHEKINGLRVLVVEDDQDTRDLMGHVLRSHGATPILAASVPEALEVFTTDKPDVVVTDIGLPGYNGYALISAIRQQKEPELGKVPVIALTAFSTEDDRRIALSSGFNEYLCKPFDPGELIGAIKHLSEEHRANR
jgi:CheY-like chemotaxis protein